MLGLRLRLDSTYAEGGHNDAARRPNFGPPNRRILECTDGLGAVRTWGTPIAMTISPRQLPYSAPQIRNRRFSDRNAAHDFWLPAETPFGDLQLKAAKIMLGVDEANWKIASAFGQWRRLAGSTSLGAHSRHSLDLENAVFMLRRVADEIISVHAVLSHLEEHGLYPDRIGIDCVGALLKYGSALNSAPFRGHQETLRTLNDVMNANKHTFIDASPAMAGRHEPVITALALRRGGHSFGPKFFHVPVRSLVEGFDRFYSDAMAWLAGWSERHLPKAAA